MMTSIVLSLVMTMTLCTASYVTQTTTGYQDVVVVIEENTDLTDCTAALEQVKVSSDFLIFPCAINGISIDFFLFVLFFSNGSGQWTGIGRFFLFVCM